MLRISQNSVMSHLVNTEQSQGFLCGALAVLLVSIQNSSWKLLCHLKEEKFSVGQEAITEWMHTCINVQYFSCSGLTTTRWSSRFPQPAVEETGLGRGQGWAPLPLPSGEVWILAPEGPAARVLGFSSDSGHLLSLLSPSRKPRHMMWDTEALSIASVSFNLECLPTSCTFYFYDYNFTYY